MPRPGVSALVLLLLSLVAACDAGTQFDGSRIVTYKYPSKAMSPTLESDELISVREFGDTSSRVVARGDIVAYRWPPDTTKTFAHRLVGLPGDTLAMRLGSLYLNGKPIDEPYAWREGSGTDSISTDFDWQREFVDSTVAPSYRASRIEWGPLYLPLGFYFVLGDNRDNSLDSRYWGLLPATHIRGVVRLR